MNKSVLYRLYGFSAPGSTASLYLSLGSQALLCRLHTSQLTQVHVAGPGVALLVAFTAPQLHELDVQLVENVPVQCVNRVHQLMGKGSCQQGGSVLGALLTSLQTRPLNSGGLGVEVLWGLGVGTLNTQPLFLQEPPCWGDKWWLRCSARLRKWKFVGRHTPCLCAY